MLDLNVGDNIKDEDNNNGDQDSDQEFMWLFDGCEIYDIKCMKWTACSIANFVLFILGQNLWPSDILSF